MKVRFIDNIDENEWSKFIYNHSKCNIFQTLEMYKVYENTKNYTPIFIGIIGSNGDILGSLISVIQKEWSGPIGGLTSRCITWGGPLIKENLNEKEELSVIDTLLKEQNAIVKRIAIYMEFRNLWDIKRYNVVFKKNNYKFEEELNYIIELNKEINELWKCIKKPRRRNIQSAEKNNVKIIEMTDKNSVQIFYKFIKEVYDNVPHPLVDISYFQSVYNILVPKNYAKFYLAIHNGEYIGGKLILIFNKRIHAMYVGGSFEHRRLNANSLLTWKIIEWGNKNDFHIYDFGGAGKPGKLMGIQEFKKQFGGELVNFGRYQNVLNKTKMKIASMGLKIIKKIK